MNDLISLAQSAFIKRRSIHDNYMFVRNYTRWMHRRKKATLLFKLDIKKAFDSVCWEYILELLQRLGFLPQFRDWIMSLLYSSSSRPSKWHPGGPYQARAWATARGSALSPPF
jgi:hypothetical protein